MKKLNRIVLAFGLALYFIAPAFAENRGILTEVVIPAGAAYMVSDVMDGVEARYRTMVNPDFIGEYSCAGYVKKYYQDVYSIYVDNLDLLGPPRGRALSEGSVPTRDIFIKADYPQKGDIIFYASPPHRNNHSAIVKSFDGELITLIEQNFKWAQDNGTYTWLNRTIPFIHNQNPYEIWRLAHIQNEPVPQPTPPSETVPVQEPITDPSHDFSTDSAPEPTPTQAEEAFTDDNPVIYEFVFNPREAETVPVFQVLPNQVLPENDFIVENNFIIEPGPIPHFTNEVVVGIGNHLMIINGEPMQIDAPPYIENDRMMMPVRYLSYALGLTTQDLVWDEPSRSVTIHNKENVIQFTIDSAILFVNGFAKMMDSMAVVTDDFAYLPVRFLAEAMGITFEWDPVMAEVCFFLP